MGVLLSKEKFDLPLGYSSLERYFLSDTKSSPVDASGLKAFERASLDEKTLLHDSLKAKNVKESTVLMSHFLPLLNLSACSQHLTRLSPHIGILSFTKSLTLCCNNLTEIPPEIGYMQSLTKLDLSRNKITFLPETIGHLTQLTSLYLSSNQLESIPTRIRNLTKLVEIHFDHNSLECLPSELGCLVQLVSADFSFNPIFLVPAELIRLQNLKTLKLDHCPLGGLVTSTEVEETRVSLPRLSHRHLPPSAGPHFRVKEDGSHSRSFPPSLKELSARTIVRHHLPILKIMRSDLNQYLSSVHSCSCCQGPYFDSFVSKTRFVQKFGYRLPLEYRLCVRHWDTDQERIAMLFAPPPITAPHPVEVSVETLQHDMMTIPTSTASSLSQSMLQSHARQNSRSIRRNTSTSLTHEDEIQIIPNVSGDMNPSQSRIDNATVDTQQSQTRFSRPSLTTSLRKSVSFLTFPSSHNDQHEQDGNASRSRKNSVRSSIRRSSSGMFSIPSVLRRRRSTSAMNTTVPVTLLTEQPPELPSLPRPSSPPRKTTSRRGIANVDNDASDNMIRRRRSQTVNDGVMGLGFSRRLKRAASESGIRFSRSLSVLGFSRQDGNHVHGHVHTRTEEGEGDRPRRFELD